MISTDTTDSSNEPFLLQEPSYQTSDPELIPNPWIRTGKTALFFAALRAAVRKYRLGVCKLKKSKIPKLCQNIGLGKLFLEK